MLDWTRYLWIVMLMLVASSASAQNQPQKTLPAVLIIGDAVYQQAHGVKQELKEQATVTFAAWPANLLPNSTNAIEHIDLLLGFKDGKGNDLPEGKRPIWKLIHLNVGLGDLIHRVPGLKSHRSLPHDFGGVITTNAVQYEKNVDALIQLIKKKAPQAKVAWASTTPIRSSPQQWFKPGSEVEYNQIAARVMNKHRVPINDMYAYALGLLEMKKPAGADPFHFDKKPLHPPVVNSILQELKRLP